MKSEEHFEYMNSLESRNTSLKNEISETRTVMESTAVGLQNRKENKDNKDCAIDWLNGKMRIITEEKMKMKRKHDNIIENLELCKKVAKDECYHRKSWRKKKIKEARGRNVTLKASSHILYRHIKWAVERCRSKTKWKMKGIEWYQGELCTKWRQARWKLEES